MRTHEDDSLGKIGRNGRYTRRNDEKKYCDDCEYSWHGANDPKKCWKIISHKYTGQVTVVCKGYKKMNKDGCCQVFLGGYPSVGGYS